MKQIVLSFLISFTITGCNFKEAFKQPKVVSVSPKDKSTLVSEDTKIKIIFSHQMDETKTNQAFSLVASQSGKVAGFFRWDNNGKEMTFTPQEGLAGEEIYTITVTEEAEDRKGNDLQESFASTFSPGDDQEPPKLKDHTPKSDTTGNSPKTSIVLTFSEPMDLNSIYRGITISPAPEGNFSWNADITQITFQPLYGFSYGVTYRVTLSPSLKDVNGMAFAQTESFNFTVGKDFESPFITEVYQELSTQLQLSEDYLTEGCEKDAMLVLKFNELIDSETLRASISFSPSRDFYITTSTTGQQYLAKINFTENLESETTYTLNVSNSITDLENNKLIKPYRYRFKTNGANSICPLVTKIGDSLTETWQMGEVQPLKMDGTTYDGITVKFSQPIEPTSLKVSTTTLAGTGFSLKVVNINWNAERNILTFGLSGISAGNIYKLNIHGGASGIEDQNGNKMKEDFIQLIHF